MLRFAKRLVYRDKVLDHLGTLLLMYPRGRQFPDDFPGLRAAIRSHFDAGTSAAGAAVQLAAQIIGDLIRQLAPEQRASVLMRMEAMDDDELRSLAARQLSGNVGERGDSIAFSAQLIGVALFLARRMTEEALIHRSDYEVLLARLHDVLGAGREAALDGTLSLSATGRPEGR